MTIFVNLLLCISAYVPQHDARVFGAAANARGYDVFVGWSEGCAATLHASDSDWATTRLLGYNDGTLDGGCPAALTPERAADIITAWEARF